MTSNSNLLQNDTTTPVNTDSLFDVEQNEFDNLINESEKENNNGNSGTSKRFTNSPWETASFLSTVLFAWLLPLIFTGYRKHLETEDLYPLPKSKDISKLKSRFETTWNSIIDNKLKKASTNKQMKSKNKEDKISLLDDYYDSSVEEDESSSAKISSLSESSLKWALFKTLLVMTKKDQFWAVIYWFAFIFWVLVQPFILNYLIISAEFESIWPAVVAAIFLMLSSIAIEFSIHHSFSFSQLAGQDGSVAVSAVVYEKSLSLNTISKGEVVTLMSVDCQRMTRFLWEITSFFIMPILMLGSVITLYYFVGLAALGVIVVGTFLGVANYQIMQKFESLQDKLMKCQDARVKKITEVLQGILVVKFFSWETGMKKYINESRNKELNLLKTFVFSVAGMTFLFLVSSSAIAAAVFFLYGLLGNEITAQIAFPVISLINGLSWVLIDYPNVIALMFESATSIERLSKFIAQDELPKQLHLALDDQVANDSIDNQTGLFINNIGSEIETISIKNGTFTWRSTVIIDEEAAKEEAEEEQKSNASSSTELKSVVVSESENKPVLHDINLSVTRGELIAVIGTVGAGKSSLLYSLLGELKQAPETTWNVNGSVAYVAQQAWIRNANVRENIICSLPFDEQRYRQCIAACALIPDLKMLAAGDKTEIGQKGINLSGGQKQRINIARALYFNTDIVLMDDPLSAVDAHVGEHLFKKCIRKAMAGKTRILVTHQLQFLPQVDRIVLMKDGRIDQTGTYEELVSRGVKFASLISADDSKKMMLSSSSTDSLNFASFNLAASAPKEEQADIESSTKIIDDDSGKLIEDEERYTGHVSLSVYKDYMSYIGSISFLLLILGFFFVVQIVQVGSDVWLAHWSGNSDTINVKIGVGMYVLLGAIGAVLVGSRQALWAFGTWKAAKQLHSNMLDRVLLAPMSFFHTTPQGRIVNRFSKDQNTADTWLPDSISDALICLFYTCSRYLTVIVLAPLSIIILFPISCAYWYFVQLYRSSARELTRLQSITSSPVYAHFDETLDGLASIRAYNMQRPLTSESEGKMADLLKVRFLTEMINRWACVSTGLFSGLTLGCISLTVVVTNHFYPISPAMIGFTISSAVGICGALSWFVRCTTKAEAEMAKIERILHYTKLPIEPQSASAEYLENPLPSSWPDRGQISFDDVVMRYRPELQPVLKGVSFTIQPKEKIGIVGRTGAGKSSLMMTLFRINEICEGTILIDGIDISKIAIKDLRSRLSIIPQDPVMFAGSLRWNLDPMGIYTDLQLWDALEKVNLKSFVTSLQDKLDYKIEESGANLSVGQRQLICIARALLKKTTILIMDEATASVDSETDALIQNTIRVCFKHCTVLTIAHRLATVIDYDKVLVMDKGCVVEFDSPSALLNDKNGAFTALVNNTGKDSANYLLQAANVNSSSTNTSTNTTTTITTNSSTNNNNNNDNINNNNSNNIGLLLDESLSNNNETIDDDDDDDNNDQLIEIPNIFSSANT